MPLPYVTYINALTATKREHSTKKLAFEYAKDVTISGDTLPEDGVVVTVHHKNKLIALFYLAKRYTPQQ